MKTLNTSEDTLVQLFPLLGALRVRTLLTEWEEGQQSTTKVTKAAKQAANFGEALVPSKRQGAPVDPNSAQRRVWAEVTRLLKASPNGVDMKEKWETCAAKLDMPVIVFKRNALKTPGVSRNYGVWKLA